MRTTSSSWRPAHVPRHTRRVQAAARRAVAALPPVAGSLCGVPRLLRGALRPHLGRVAPRNARGGGEVPGLQDSRAWLCARAMRGRRLWTRVPRGVLVQGALLLPELPRQATRALDALARGDAARPRGVAPASSAHHPQTAARVVSVSPPVAGGHRPGRRSDGDGGGAHNDAGARARRGHRGLRTDARLQSQLAPPHPL